MKVGIVGVGVIPYKVRHPDKTYYELALEALGNALDDAKITREEVDSVVYGLADLYVLAIRQACASTILQDYLGMEGKPAVTVTGAAITGALAVKTAYTDILSGMSEVSLVLSAGKGLDFYDQETGKRSTGFLTAIMVDSDANWERAALAGPSMFALMVQAHMDKYGCPTEEQMAKVSVKNHGNALDNPLAQSGKDLSIEDVFKSRRLAGAVKFLDCCLYSEGAAALILAREDRAKEISDKVVWIEGIGVSIKRHLYPDYDNLGRLPNQFIATKKAYEMAGIKDPVNELDLAELHDAFTGTEIMAYEDCFFCDEGDGGRLVDDGTIMHDGKLPVNLSGGLIGCGHAVGATGIMQTYEVALHLRDEAGERQHRNARCGLVQSIGGTLCTWTVCLVLERGEM